MKKLLVVSAIAALGLSSMALANGAAPIAPSMVSDDAGMYLGLSGGWAMQNWKNVETDGLTVSKDDGFAARAFAGYDINKYFAVEMGYSYLGFFKPQLATDGVVFFQAKDTQAVDLVGKIKAPVADDVSLYAKLGGDYLMTKEYSPLDGSSRNLHNFNVAYGAGVDFDVTSNVIVNAEWMRLNGNAKVTSDDYQPNADMFLLGVRYKFFM